MDSPDVVVRTYFPAFENLDLDGTIALFTDDAVIMADDFNGVAEQSRYEPSTKALREDADRGRVLRGRRHTEEP